MFASLCRRSRRSPPRDSRLIVCVLNAPSHSSFSTFSFLIILTLALGPMSRILASNLHIRCHIQHWNFLHIVLAIFNIRRSCFRQIAKSVDISLASYWSSMGCNTRIRLSLDIVIRRRLVDKLIHVIFRSSCTMNTLDTYVHTWPPP